MILYDVTLYLIEAIYKIPEETHLS